MAQEEKVADWLLQSTCLVLPLNISTLYETLAAENICASRQEAVQAIAYLLRVIPTSLQVQRTGAEEFVTFVDLNLIEIWRRGTTAWGGASASASTYAPSWGPGSSTNLHASDNESDFSTSFSTTASSVDWDKDLSGFKRDTRSQLFNEIYAKGSTAELAAEFDQLLYSPSFAMTTLHNQNIARTPLEAHLAVCPHNSGCNCKDKLHLERVVVPTTDLSLGDCNYLDTCFKGRGCRYVHYKVQPPNNGTVWTTGTTAPPSPAAIPPQYIQCNLRNIDLAKLGNDYGVIIADPPWEIHMNGSKPNSETLSDDEFARLNISALQTQGIMLLWVTGRAIDAGRRCLRKWGYDAVEELLWIKINQLGRTIGTGRTGHWLNHTKEHLLVGIKGDPKFLTRQLELDTLVSVARGNSRKPDELYGMVERIVADNTRKLELFGRDHNVRPGWLTLGNEISGTCLHDPLLKFRWSRAQKGAKAASASASA